MWVFESFIYDFLHICFVLFSKTLIMFIARSVLFFSAIRLCLYLHRRAVMKILVVLLYFWSDSNGIKHIKLKFDYHNMGQKVCYGRNLQCLLLFKRIWRWWNTLWIKCLFVPFLLRKYQEQEIKYDSKYDWHYLHRNLFPRECTFDIHQI